MNSKLQSGSCVAEPKTETEFKSMFTKVTGVDENGSGIEVL